MGTGRNHPGAVIPQGLNKNVIDLSQGPEGERVLQTMRELGHTTVDTTPAPEQPMVGAHPEPAPQPLQAGKQR